jgi:hypothetical protein
MQELKNGEIGPDTERQSENDGESETWRSRQLAHRITEVPVKAVEHSLHQFIALIHVRTI